MPNRPEDAVERPVVIDQQRARQGYRVGLIYILGVSLTLAVIAMAIMYLIG